MEGIIVGRVIPGAPASDLMLASPRQKRPRGWVFATTGTAFHPDTITWAQLDDPASDVGDLVPEEAESKETLDWAESCRAARRIFEHMEARSRLAREREAALIEELDLGDVDP
jgi:hypothetical protein